jgi:hypothetical protein
MNIRLGKTRIANALLLLLLPVVYLATYVIVGNQKGPYYWTSNQDPDYAYLLDSLNLVNSYHLHLFQHPGTPFQMLAAIVIRLSYWVQSLFNSAIAPLNVDVLTHPELYLALINYVCLTLTAVCLLILGFISLSLSRNLYLSLILQLTPLLMIRPILALEPSRVAPEALLLIAGLILVMWLVVYLYQRGVERSLWFAISFGVIAGFGTAAKVTFVPALFFAVLIHGWWRKGVALLVAILSFIVFVPPTLVDYGSIKKWLTRLSTHTGLYGTGEAGLIDVKTLPQTLQVLIADNWFLLTLSGLLILECVLLIFLWQRDKSDIGIQLTGTQPKKLVTLSLLIPVAICLQIVLSLHEVYEVHYLTPSFSLAGLMVLLAIQLGFVIASTLRPNFPTWSHLSEFVMLACLSICLAFSIYQTYLASASIATGANLWRSDLNQLEATLKKPEYQSCVLTISRLAPRIEAALFFAQIWSGDNFASLLDQLYPNTIVRRYDGKRYQSYTQDFNEADLLTQGQGCILFETNRDKRIIKRLLRRVFRWSRVELYRVKQKIE